MSDCVRESLLGANVFRHCLLNREVGLQLRVTSLWPQQLQLIVFFSLYLILRGPVDAGDGLTMEMAVYH